MQFDKWWEKNKEKYPEFKMYFQFYHGWEPRYIIDLSGRKNQLFNQSLLRKWCNLNCEGKWEEVHSRCFFENINDTLKFKLVWFHD